MTKEVQKKILFFDINPGNDEITKELIFGKISNAIKKASINSHVVFLSHSNLSLLKKILFSINIKNAYIISDAGARIFDYGNNQIIFEKKISRDIALATIHTGIILNNLVLVSSDQHALSYSYNFLNQSTLSKKHYSKLSCTNDFQKFFKFIESNDIFSIMVFNNNYEKLFQSYERFSKLSNEWNFELQKSISTYFLITEENYNKSTAMKYMMNYLKISNVNDVFYYALNTYDKESLLTVKNRYVYQEVVLLSELKNKHYTFELDINSLAQSIVKNTKSLV